MKRCCFAGHSKIDDKGELYKKLVSVIEKLITEENVTEFWVGNYGQFDGLSAKAVRELKKTYPHIKLELIIPYLTTSINEYKEMYYKNYDNILMADIPEKTPKRFHIVKCNEYIVNSSDCLICYINHGWGGAAGTAEYARRKKIKIINLGDLNK